MSTAYCMMKRDVAERYNAYVAGLSAAGYKVVQRSPDNTIRPGDCVVMWNKKRGHNETIADRVEKQGGTVFVAENGYLGKDKNGFQLNAISIHGHNGSGAWRVGEHDRFADLNVRLREWRDPIAVQESGHILVCGQRGIGSQLMHSPPDWHNKMAERLRKLTNRPIIVRAHPGGKPDPNAPTLESQFVNCWAVVIWSSTSGIKALINGIPVFYDAPHFICSEAATRDISLIEAPPMPDRLPALRSMAWAQWTMDEIARGVPFRTLREA